jgi:hypothetical protein
MIDPLLNIYPKEMKLLCQKDICTPVSFAALLTVAVKQNKMSLSVCQPIHGKEKSERI